MIRLSRRGWNNVIIISMLVLIVLFNSSSNLLNNNEVATGQLVPLLPANSVLMTIDFGAQKVERIGRGWRIQSAHENAITSEMNLNQLVINWQQSEMLLSDDLQRDNGLVVVVWLAGQEQARIYQFYQSKQNLLVEVDQQLYQIANLNLKQLVLPGVL